MPTPNIDIPMSDRKIAQLIRATKSETHQALLETQGPPSSGGGGGGGDTSALEAEVAALKTKTDYVHDSFSAGGVVGNMAESVRLLNILSPSAITKDETKWVKTGDASMSSWQGGLSAYFAGEGSLWLESYPGEVLSGSTPRGVSLKNLKAGDSYIISADIETFPTSGYQSGYPTPNVDIVESADNTTQTSSYRMYVDGGTLTLEYVVPSNLDGGSMAFGIVLEDLDPLFQHMRLKNVNVRNVTEIVSLADRVAALEQAIQTP